VSISQVIARRAYLQQPVELTCGLEAVADPKPYTLFVDVNLTLPSLCPAAGAIQKSFSAPGDRADPAGPSQLAPSTGSTDLNVIPCPQRLSQKKSVVSRIDGQMESMLHLSDKLRHGLCPVTAGKGDDSVGFGQLFPDALQSFFDGLSVAGGVENTTYGDVSTPCLQFFFKIQKLIHPAGFTDCRAFGAAQKNDPAGSAQKGKQIFAAFLFCNNHFRTVLSFEF
jgi:hypothetical protein